MPAPASGRPPIGNAPRHALASPCPYRRHRRRVTYNRANRNAAPCGRASPLALPLALLKDNAPFVRFWLALCLHFAGELKKVESGAEYGNSGYLLRTNLTDSYPKTLWKK